MARPSKYKEDYSKEIEEYLSSCGTHSMKMPQVGDFARFIGISRDTAYAWEKKHKKFSDTIKRIKDIQRIQLINDGLYGGREVNSTMAIFLLKANHGMIETERKEILGKDGAPLGVVVLPETYEDRKNMDSPQGATDGSSKKE